MMYTLINCNYNYFVNKIYFNKFLFLTYFKINKILKTAQRKRCKKNGIYKRMSTFCLLQ